MSNAIIEQFKLIVPFLGEVLGRNCEVVLQDLSDDIRSVVAISNNHISNREVGAPLTDYALEVIRNNTADTKDYECNYLAMAGNKSLRSSTFFIKDKGKLIGMLCINIDNSEYYDLCERIMVMAGMKPKAYMEIVNSAVSDIDIDVSEKPTKENLSTSLNDSILQVISQYEQENGYLPADHFSQEDKMEVVRRLNKKGLFMLKGAVTTVAEMIHCSDASVYRYISKISKGER